MAPNSSQIRSESWQLIEQQLQKQKQKQKPNDSKCREEKKKLKNEEPK